jgi:hypothetical protein
VNQRWLNRIGSFRSPDEIINTHAYEIAELLDDNTPKAFVEQHHYSGSYPAARARFGLYEIATAALVGVAVFSHPPNEAVLRKLPCERMSGIELGRFVLLDNVAGNGESWFLARCFEQLRAKGIEALISHSDPLPRRSTDGTIVLPGHVGNVYQATNAVYGGRASKRALWIMPDGTCFSERAMSKLRKRERGYRYAIEQLVAAGADRPLDIGQDLTEWMMVSLAKVGRRIKHGGNHRYLWAINKKLRKQIEALALTVEDDDGNITRVAYPKTLDVEAA